MTNSPPAKVSLKESESARVMTSGIDTLYLSINAKWGGDSFFNYLEELKGQAESEKPSPGFNFAGDDIDDWHFNVRAFGVNGYEWVLDSGDVCVELLSNMEPCSRPNIRVLFRSEFLWRLGVKGACDWMLKHLKKAGVAEMSVKPSRIDPCVDILIREKDWTIDLRPMFTTRAILFDPHYRNDKLTGFSIGRGKIMVRLYDKPLEIATKSRKYWMYDVWGIGTAKIPENLRVIRVEFQLTREKIKELGIDLLSDLYEKLLGLWAYCTQSWLKIQDNPGKHHTQRHVLPWWEVVQNGFDDIQGAEPLIRNKVIRADREHLFHQLMGIFSSLVALRSPGHLLQTSGILCIHQELALLNRMSYDLGFSDEKFTESVVGKMAKYHRHIVRTDTVASDEVPCDVPF